MASYNRIVLMGNLTGDPQLSFTPWNTPICKFRLATNHKWKDRDGNLQEEVCFVDCTLFGRSAEPFNQYLKKGQPVLVEGRLRLDQWTSPEGEKKSKHVVIVDNFTFVGGGRDGGDSGRSADRQTEGASPAAAAASAEGAPQEHGGDDIPF